ncbi:MAG TPA: VWA domain-containing protein [Pyrinomonadaceae bacterium]|nr:VWA domain-containing protein [Pyrinomonadaceae bacterium]
MLVAGVSLTAPAQRGSQKIEDDDDVVRVSTELLMYPIRVRDGKGQAVAGLTESDLRLDDKDKATSGLYFKSGVDRIALVFALDSSGSIQDVIFQQRDAAIALFDRFSDRSSIAVLQFAETSDLVVPFNRDSSAATEGFRFHFRHNQGTAIFDAAAKSIAAFASLPKVRSERQIVILISDGLDNASSIKPNSVIAQAIEKRISFYVIHLPLLEPRDGRLAVRTPSSGFRDLAEKTGGKYFLIQNVQQVLTSTPIDLTKIFKAIEEDLKSQYLLGFYISESSKDGRRHVFSLGLLPPGIKYSVGQFGFSREHKFQVQSPTPTNK